MHTCPALYSTHVKATVLEMLLWDQTKNAFTASFWLFATAKSF